MNKLRRVCEDAQKELLMHLLERHHGDVAAVIAEIGCDRAWGYKQLKRHGLDPNDYRLDDKRWKEDQ